MKKKTEKIIVNDELINNLSHLSLLEFDEVAKEKIKKELNEMISFFNVVNQFDISKETLLQQNNIPQTEKIRSDNIVHNTLSKEKALANAELKNEDFFLVPKIFKK